MIRPSSLIRRDSVQTPEFIAPANNISDESLDCGITAIPFCLPKWFHRFATPRVFIFFLAVLAVFQGSLQVYIAASILNIQEIFEYSPALVDWLTISHEIFISIVALVVGYWGNRIHRAAWIGGLACFQGAACFLVMIPYLEHMNNPNATVIIQPPTTPNLCELTHMEGSKGLELVEGETEDHCWITFGVLILLQFIVGMANVSFFAHGFSYLDDDVEPKLSPVFLGVAISVRVFSGQLGSFLAWSLLKGNNWWIGYPILGSCLIVAGILVACFPKNLLNTVLRQTAASILDIATGSHSMQSIRVVNTVDTSSLRFSNTMKRIFTNKLLLLHTFSISLVYLVVKNFASVEPMIMAAQFYLPTVGQGFQDPWTSRLIRNMVEAPLVMLTVLFSALVITKAKPRSRRILGYNVSALVKVAIVFLSYVFIDCNHDMMVGEHRGYLLSPLCSRQCDCDSKGVKFEPVCVHDGSVTYFSPCHAGCTDVTIVNKVMIFQNCVCGSVLEPSVPAIATEGACNNENCQLRWRLFQTFSIIVSAIIASTLVGNLLVAIRCVAPSDKAVSLALILGTSCFMAHVPGKLIYWAISKKTCQYPNSNGYDCNLHSPQYADIIGGLNCGLLLLAALLQSIVIYWSKDLELYPLADDDNFKRSPLQATSSPSPLGSTLELARNSRPPRPVRPAPARPFEAEAENPEEQPLNNRNDIQGEIAQEINQRLSVRSTLV